MNASSSSLLNQDQTHTVSSVTCFYFTAPIFESSATLIVNVIACVLNSSFAIFSSFGNLLIVAVLCKAKSLHKPANILLGWFAFCDFLLGFLAAPAFVAFKIAEITRNFESYCVLRSAYDFTSQTTLSASFVILTFMTIDRYLSLHLHLRYKEVITNRRITGAVLFSWILSLSITVTKLWLDPKTFLFIIKASKLLCLFVIVTVYIKILVLVRRHQIQIDQLTVCDRRGSQRSLYDFCRLKKYACTVAFIVALIIACYVPVVFVSFCKAYVCTEGVEHAKIMYTLTVTFIFFTSALHPLVYICRMREVMDAIKKFFNIKWKLYILTTKSINDRECIKLSNLYRYTVKKLRTMLTTIILCCFW